MHCGHLLITSSFYGEEGGKGRGKGGGEEGVGGEGEGARDRGWVWVSKRAVFDDAGSIKMSKTLLNFSERKAPARWRGNPKCMSALFVSVKVTYNDTNT